jgi:dTDP-4-dehydrorhamnose reductase
MRILVLGISGMLGSTVFHYLNRHSTFDVFGTLRSDDMKENFPEEYSRRIFSNLDLGDFDQLVKVVDTIKPDIVINCVGIIKQVDEADDYEKLIAINSLLPHKLNKMLIGYGARLIHISTDCVFSGSTGNYKEEDMPDARDIYGRSKLLGEIDSENCITLRTSMIGHELRTKNSLLEWFLSQEKGCLGYNNAFFSGFPAVELAKIILDYIITSPNLRGIYHVASSPISKYDLLQIIAKVYKKNIVITKDDAIVINRSLCAEKFYKKANYSPPSWEEMVTSMYEDYMTRARQ